MNGHAIEVSKPLGCLETLKTSPHSFLQPTESLHADALALAKHYLDPVAFAVSTLQSQRLNIQRKTRKRKRGSQETEEKPLRLKNVATDGFSAQQVWEQVAMIANAVEREAKEFLENIHDSSDESEDENESNSDSDLEPRAQNGNSELDDMDMDIGDSDDGEGLDEGESDEEDYGMEDAQDEEEEEEDEENEAPTTQKRPPKDKFGLNDDFFSIDEFNRRTEMLEKQDYQGEPDVDAASDEEDVDWDANPMSIPIPQNDNPENDSEEEEDGPTFGNMDLMAPEGASDEENEDMDLDIVDDGMNSNQMMYDDFFGNPKTKKKSKSKPKKQIPKGDVTESFDFEKDIERAISSTHHNIFSDEEIENEEEEKLGPDASNHEKRKAATLAQIRELEAINISKRPWVLSGEAQARDRPTNALLEEDLDFETAGKPLPVMTAEMSEDTVKMIKNRIIARDFQEARRRRPDEALIATTRRGRVFDEPFDMSQKRDRKGLADVYEEEHLKRNDPAYMDKKTEALSKDHAEIELLWKDVVTKLDSLASWRYRPKPSEATISIRSDAPAMVLEDARPSGAGGEVGQFGQLAPQEVYKPGDEKEQGKVVVKGGTVFDRAELSQDNRKRLRRREKERKKKALEQKPESKSKNSTLSKDLKKSGVKVIGKKGELRDVEGQEVREGPRILGTSLKL